MRAPANPRPVRVVLVDDHAIVRAGLETLLAAEPDVDVAAVAATGEEALELVERHRPDVAVVDYQLPGMSGVEVCAEITERFPDVHVIVLSSYLDDAIVLRSVEAGAQAYVYKDVEGAELKRAIRKVASGHAVIDDRVARRVLAWAHRRSKGPHGESLSLREVEVLRLVAAGRSNQAIADELGVTPNTVKTYLRRAGEKLGVHNRAGAAAAASKRGLL